jgi:hypothetical protein
MPESNNDWSEQRSDETHDQWTNRLALKKLQDEAKANATAETVGTEATDPASQAY